MTGSYAPIMPWMQSPARHLHPPHTNPARRAIPWCLLFLLLTGIGAPPVVAEPAPEATQGQSMARLEAEARSHLEATPPDYDQARKGFSVAAERGSPRAMAYLGWFHEHGHGVEQDTARAVSWYARAVDAGALQYTLHLGWMHLDGRRIPADQAAAEAWFQRGIQAGYVPAQVALASVWIADAMGDKSPERASEAEALLLDAHEQGAPKAEYFLAKLYLQGIGNVEADADKAFHYTRLGARRGEPTLQAWLAQQYLEGHGVEADPAQAVKWAHRSAAAGDPTGRAVWQDLENRLAPDVIREGKALAGEG
ncbi:MAG: tetratricopeptide repeat protein [Ectothiorhodospira sp.]